MKIIIIVEGGVVQAVYSEDENVDIELIDHDNLKEKGWDRVLRAGLVAEATLGMKEMYFTERK
jgi:hypothetical protein